MLSLRKILEMSEKGQTRADVDFESSNHFVFGKYHEGVSKGVKVCLGYEEDLVSGDFRIVQY